MRNHANRDFPEVMVRDHTLLGSVRAGVERILLRAGEVLPHFVAVDAKANAMFIPLNANQMHDESYKDAMCAQFTAWAMGAGIERYAFITKAWIARANDMVDTRMPSERKDRQEIVLIVGGSKNKPFFAVHEILRGADGKPTGIGPDMEIGSEISGRFTGLLDARKVTSAP